MSNSLNGKKIVMMAGGTGGHVYPALAVAQVLRNEGASVEWLGSKDKFEGKKVPQYGFILHDIKVKGLRGNGAIGWVKAPFMIFKSVLQSRKVLKGLSPDLVIGMGGFASGPGGIAAKLLGIHLLIHEQNAVMGMTNKWLSKFADRILLGDENALKQLSNERKVLVVGNPVRQEMIEVESPQKRYAKREGKLRLLVLGGSQGAKKINEVLPEALSLIAEAQRPLVTHQTGERWLEKVIEDYKSKRVEADVIAFADDIVNLYKEHDFVIARSGALTVAEIAVIGLPALFIPFPYAVDDHQTINAQFLLKSGAADIIQEKDLDARMLADYIAKYRYRDDLSAKAQRAVEVSHPDALDKIINEIKRLC